MHFRVEFALEFKQSAAKLVNEKGYSQRQAANSLGVSLSALSRWVRAERGSSNTAPVQKKVFNLLEQDELTRLRKEVAQLRMMVCASLMKVCYRVLSNMMP